MENEETKLKDIAPAIGVSIALVALLAFGLRVAHEQGIMEEDYGHRNRL